MHTAEPGRRKLYRQHRHEPLSYTVADFVAVTGISRSSAYELMRDGKLESVRVAGRRLIPRWAVEKLLRETA